MEFAANLTHDLHTQDRTPICINNATIIVCKPCLCFEKHTSEIKALRLKTEFDFWLKVKNNPSMHSDYHTLADIMLVHPLFLDL